MKVYIITRAAFPHGMSSVKRIICFAKAILSQGIDCEVIIYTRTEVYGKKPKNIQGHGVYDGIPFRYTKDTPLRESNVFVRRYNDFMDKIRLKKILNKNLKQGDVVFAYNGFYFFSSEIIKLTHNKRAFYAQELCELPFGTGVETDTTIKNRRRYERKIMPHFDGVIAISDALFEYARMHCAPQCKISKVPIMVDFPKYEMEDSSSKEDIPYIFHSGTLYQQKDGFLDMLVAFAKASLEIPFPVRFISTGNYKGTFHEREIDEILDKYALRDKVIFTGYLSNEELRNYLAKASFVVIDKLKTQQNKYCFSTKLGEYMAASKPIIITRVGEAMNWLSHNHDAYIIEPNDINALVDAMKLMFTDEVLRHKLGTNVQQTCKEKFSISGNAKEIVRFIKNECQYK